MFLYMLTNILMCISDAMPGKQGYFIFSLVKSSKYSEKYN